MNKNITINDRDGKVILLNWDNVKFIRESSNYFNEIYSEIQFVSGKPIDTNETIQQIKEKIGEN